MGPKIHHLLAVFATHLRTYRYAPSSIKAYKNALAKFLTFHGLNNLDQLDKKQILCSLSTLLQKENISPSYERQIRVAICKFYHLYYNKPLDLSALYTKQKRKPLPKYLTKVEVRRLLDKCHNLKHICLLKILYGCGLCVSEVVKLNVEDIDCLAMRILVRNPNGGKDRVVPLPQLILDDLYAYFKVFKPKEHLFEGQNGGKYSIKSIQQLTKKYAREAQITKAVTPRLLRHSYAVHQLENGTTIRDLQKLMGHHSIHTTAVYARIFKITKDDLDNPLDGIYP